jgi:integrase
MAKVLCTKDTETGVVEELHLDLLNGFSALKKIEINKAVEKYLTDCTAFKSVPSQRLERKYFPIFLDHLDQFKLKYIHEINVEHIDAFQNVLLKRMSPQSVRKRLSTFKHFFNKCIHWNYVYKSPFVGMRPLKFEINRRKSWTQFQYESFINSIGDHMTGCFKFLWLTGCRPTELINLNWTDIDYESKEITFRCGKNSHIARKFPIYEELDILLHSLPFKGNKVFYLSDKDLKTDRLSHYARKWLRRLGFNDLTVYGIRHSLPARLIEMGFGAFEIRDVMGHSDIKTTLNYLHLNKKDLIQKFNNIKSC